MSHEHDWFFPPGCFALNMAFGPASARGFTWINRFTGSMVIGFGVLLAFLRRSAV